MRFQKIKLRKKKIKPSAIEKRIVQEVTKYLGPQNLPQLDDMCSYRSVVIVTFLKNVTIE